MAIVRISKQLIDDVSDKINSMYRKEIHEARKAADVLTDRSTQVSSDRLSDEDLLTVERMLWGEHHHLKAIIPQQWCYRLYSDNLRCNIPSPAGTLNFTLCVPHNNQKLFGPPNQALPILTFDHVPSWVKETVDYTAKVAAVTTPINNKYNLVKDQIITLLKNSASLNAAIKVFPDLRLYLTEEYIERLDQVVEKRKTVKDAADVVAGFDTSLLTAVAVRHSLGD